MANLRDPPSHFGDCAWIKALSEVMSSLLGQALYNFRIADDPPGACRARTATARITRPPLPQITINFFHAILPRVLTETFVVPVKSSRPSLLTLASIGTIACVAADMVHEALGHGTASWLTGDRILSLSTVAIQNATANRFVSAAGTSANCIVGILSLLLLRRIRKLTSLAYFLWIFGAYNLLNSGYLVTSAVLKSGDWANVIAGLFPPWLWRCVLGLAGATLYVLAIRWVANFMIDLVNRGEVALADLRHLVLPAYLAGGAAMTIASIFNPIGPSLILLSGAGASFGLNSGLLFLPGIVAANARGQTLITRPMPFSFFWFALGLVVAGIFIGVLGPGIHFPN